MRPLLYTIAAYGNHGRNGEIVEYQLYHDNLAVPFGRFHAAIEAVLGRSVWTHEFTNSDRLRKEFEALIMSRMGANTARLEALASEDER